MPSRLLPPTRKHHGSGEERDTVYIGKENGDPAVQNQHLYGEELRQDTDTERQDVREWSDGDRLGGVLKNKDRKTS